MVQIGGVMIDFYIQLIEKSGFSEALVCRSLDLASKTDFKELSHLFFDTVPFYVSDTGVLFFDDAFYPFEFYDKANAHFRSIGISPETGFLYLYIALAEEGYSRHKERNLPENICFDTLKTLKNASETYFKSEKNEGIYDYHFLANHVRGSIIKLGEFEYQYGFYKSKKSIILHVPDGADLEKQKRLYSYKLARQYFGNHPIVGDSWLLYPELSEMLTPNSKILDFANDFDIVSVYETYDYKELFHIFGRDADYSKPHSLKQSTSLQKALVRRITERLKIGSATGILKY